MGSVPSKGMVHIREEFEGMELRNTGFVLIEPFLPSEVHYV